jgi:hypothetical protein
MYMRNLAMSTGHEGALLYVYRVLQRHAFADGPTQPEGILERQLTREYGVRFERVLAAEARNALPKVPEVPVSEAKRSIKVLKDIGRFKEELESYEPEDDDGKKIQKLYMQVGPKKDVASTVYFPRDALPPMIDMWPANIPPSAQTPKNRSERRAIAAAAAKKKPDGTVPEPAGKGPNFGRPIMSLRGHLSRTESTSQRPYRGRRRSLIPDRRRSRSRWSISARTQRRTTSYGASPTI